MDKPEDDIQHKFEDSSLVERALDAMTSEMENFTVSKSFTIPYLQEWPKSSGKIMHQAPN